MVTFEQASYLSKVKRLRALAEIALGDYPIKVRSIEFIKLSANAIFRVTDNKNKQFQLRINPKIFHNEPAIYEEIKWLNHIKNKTNILVPTPIKNNYGKFAIECFHPMMSSPRFCTLFEWLPGKTKWKTINESYALNLGKLISQLQESGRHLNIKHRIYWNADSLVGTSKAKFYNIEKLHDVTPNQQKLITQARKVTHHKLKQYEKLHKEKYGLIHGDMQPNNILVNKGKYAVIDFDDCGMGLYGVDLGTALCAFEHVAEGNERKNFQSLQDSLLHGYAEHMPLTQQDINLLPYFMLSIKLMTIAWLEIRRDNPQVRGYYQIAVNRAIEFYKKI
ncbi:MAG: phosphotransferase [Proteobacteria bacterium]|nr:phosphotransferase [Pseudomonadota bacterium]